MTKKKNLPNVSVIISYVPLLKAKKPFLEDGEDVKSIVDEAEKIETYAKGVIWTLEDGIAVASMLYPMGTPIANHLKEWAEGDQERWFTLAHLKDEGRYAMALMPDVEKSVRRTKFNYQMVHGWPMPDKTNFQIFFAPLTFLSNTSGAYDQMKDYLKDGSKVKVCLADFTEDMKSMAPEKLMEMIPKVRTELGIFPVRTPDVHMGYLREMFKEE
jgi:hypothetical protein